MRGGEPLLATLSEPVGSYGREARINYLICCCVVVLLCVVCGVLCVTAQFMQGTTGGGTIGY